MDEFMRRPDRSHSRSDSFRLGVIVTADRSTPLSPSIAGTVQIRPRARRGEHRCAAPRPHDRRVAGTTSSSSTGTSDSLSFAGSYSVELVNAADKLSAPVPPFRWLLCRLSGVMDDGLRRAAVHARCGFRASSRRRYRVMTAAAPSALPRRLRSRPSQAHRGTSGPRPLHSNY